MVLHRHLVVGDVAARAGVLAIEVGQTHGECIPPQRAGNVAQNGFDHDHALRATKAAKRRVALRVRLAAVRGDFYVAQVIGVVGVEHRTVGHGA